jgi:hypothetical protein
MQLIAPSATPQEAAAVVAALERFNRATAPPFTSAIVAEDAWRRAAVLEGVEREALGGLPDPWLAPE